MQASWWPLSLPSDLAQLRVSEKAEPRSGRPCEYGRKGRMAWACFTEGLPSPSRRSPPSAQQGGGQQTPLPLGLLTRGPPQGDTCHSPGRYSRLPTGCSPSGQPEVDARLPPASAVLPVSHAQSPGQRGRPGPSPDSSHCAISSVPRSVCPFTPGACGFLRLSWLLPAPQPGLPSLLPCLHSYPARG